MSHAENSVPYILPSICPSCSAPVIREEGEAAVRCVNPECQAQLLRNVIHFCSRDAMDIEGLGDALVEKFISENLISNVADIYDITAGEIMMLEGHQERSAKISSRLSNARSKMTFHACCSLWAYAISVRKRRSFFPSILAILIL